MAEPSEKSPEMTEFLDSISNRSEAIKGDICINPPLGCGKPAPPDSFRDDLSRREFAISGLCQNCQDDIFGHSE